MIKLEFFFTAKDNSFSLNQETQSMSYDKISHKYEKPAALKTCVDKKYESVLYAGV